MQSWKTTTNRKKIQRYINKVVRALNKNIYNDPLWKGRFYMQQTKCLSCIDNGWLYMNLEFVLVDRETGIKKYIWLRKDDFMGTTRRVWEALNDFMVVDCKVWDVEPRITRETTKDYRGYYK